jgi:hypothetical protein
MAAMQTNVSMIEGREMKEPRLNLEMLRTGGPRGDGQAAGWLAGVLSSLSLRGCSRRDFLLLSSATLPATTLPLLEHLPSSFEMRGDEQRLAFAVEGREAWVIEPGRFSGSPRLRVRKDADVIRLGLENAWFPGTSIPADFLCELRRGPLQWQMKLDLALASFRSEVPFVRWLLLEAPATCSVRLNLVACELSSGALELRAGGPAVASFSPAWVVQLEGRGVAKLRGPTEGAAVADALQVALPSGSAPSFLSPPPARRSLLVLERGLHPWQVLPAALMRGKPWKLVALDGVFNRIMIEVGEDQAGRRYGVAAACSAVDAVAAAFHPRAGLAGGDGGTAGLQLCNLRYAASFGAGPRESAVLADFHGDGAWLASGGLNLKVGSAPGSRGLELLAATGHEASIRAAPAVLAAAVELPDAPLSSLRFSNAPHLELSWGAGDAPDHPSGICFDREDSRVTLQLDAAVLTVTRPRDLLRLEFKLTNLRLKSRWGKLYLERTPASVTDPDAYPALITAVFPPQSILEQAFFDADPHIAVDIPKDFPQPVKCKLEPDIPSCPTAPTTSEPPPDPPVCSRISGASRLVFALNPKTRHVPFTLTDLLNWTEYDFQVAPRAKTVKPSTPEAVAPVACDQTMIEVPYRLMISPNERAGWAHSVRPRDLGTRYTELWHTHLGVLGGLDQAHRRVDEDATTERTIRALWSPDFVPLSGKQPAHAQDPFRASLDARDRDEIVHLSSNFDIKKAADPKDPQDSQEFMPSAIAVDDLRLTALGAWMKSRGSWVPPVLLKSSDPTFCAFTVEEWKHQATMARDHYVRVVYKGYLFPFGHHASLVKVTERRFEDAPSGGVAAYQRQRMFIVVREPTKSYAAVGQPHAGRQLPCTKITLTTVVTPNLEDPAASMIPGTPALSAFWPQVAGEDFRFHYLLEDANGRKAEATLPLIFVDNNVAHQNPGGSDLKRVFDEYKKPEPEAVARRVSADVGGKKISFAASKKPGDTEFETLSLTYRADAPDIPSGKQPPTDLCLPPELDQLLKVDQPPFYPAVEQALIRVAAIQAMSGNQTDSVTVHFDQQYLNVGFDPVQNRGEVFLALGSGLDLGFGGGASNADRSGGVVTPSTNIVGLSRRLGPVGGGAQGSATQPPAGGAGVPPGAPDPDPLDKVRSGTFDPLDFFGGALEQAKILGGIKLWDIIRPFAQGVLDNLGEAPRMLTQLVYEAVDQANDQVLQALSQLQQQVPAQFKSTFQARFGPITSRIADNIRRVRDGAVDREPEVVQDLVRLVDGVADLVRNPGVLAQDAIVAVTQLLDAQLDPVLAQVGAFVQQLDELQAQANQAKDQVVDTLSALQTEAKQSADRAVGQLQQAQLLADTELFGHLRQDVQQQVDAVLAAAQLAQLAKTAIQQHDWQAVAQIVAAQVGILDPLRGLALQLQRLGDAQALPRQVPDLQKALEGFFMPVRLPASGDLTSLEVELEPIITALSSQPPLAKQLTALRDAVRRDFSDLAAYEVVEAARVRSFLQRQKTLLADFTQMHGFLDRNQLPHGPLSTKIMDWGSQLTALDPASAKKTRLGALVDLLKPAVLQPGGLSAEVSKAGQDLSQGLDALSGLSIGPWLEQASRALDLAERVRDPVELAILILGIAKPEYRAKLAQAATIATTIISDLRTIGNQLKDLQVLSDALEQSLPALAKALVQTQLKNLADHVHDLATAAQVAAVDELVALEQQVLADLQQILDRLLGELGVSLQDVAALLQTAESLRALLAQLIPTSLTLSYDWSPTLKSFPADQPVFEVEEGSKLTVHARFTMPLRPGGTPDYQVQGMMENFHVNLIAQPQFISVIFDSLSFTAGSGAKADCKVKIRSVQLADDFNFINALESFFSPDQGPFLELSKDGILTGFRFGIPSLTLGAFNLNDLRLGVAVNLPFSGDPMRLRLMVSDRGHPFLLSSGIFGGGGFFGLALGLDGVEMVEGALEFGVTAELSIGGVAHGSGYILAGIYFRTEGSRARVCGFVRAGGEMDIVGLVSMSIEVHVDLCYDADTGSVTGEAVYVVHIQLLFLSKSVELHASYTFAGSSRSKQSGLLDRPAPGTMRLAANTADPLAGGGALTDGAADPASDLGRLAAQAASSAAGTNSGSRPSAATCPQPGFRNLGDPVQYRQYRRKFARKRA